MIRELFFGDSLLWSCVWQSTIFFVVGLVGSFILRHRSSRAHQVLLLSMMAAVIVPITSILVKHYELGVFVDEPVVIQSEAEDWAGASDYGASEIISAENIEHKSGPIEEDLPPAIAGSDSAGFPWRLVVLCGWIAASLILATRLVVTFVLGVRLLGRALPLDCRRIKEAVHLAKAKLGIDKDVKVSSSRSVRSPVIWCWRRNPVLLVPNDAGRFDNGIDWAGVLCHELAHWKRRDHLSGLFAELVVCILPWHPLVWWAKSRLVRLSEQACDDWVVATGQPGTDYAESLLDLTPGGQMAFVPAVVSSKKGLADRIRRILQDKCGNPRTGAVWALAVSIVTLCLVVGIAFAQARPAAQPTAVQEIIVPTIGLAEPEEPNDVESNVIVIRLVDSDGRPVAGAKVGTNVRTRDTSVLGSKLSWSLRGREHNISNEGGEIKLTREKLFIPSWPLQRNVALYILHEGRKLGAFCEISRADKRKEIEVTLEPICHVHGKLSSSGLQDIGQPLTWTNVYFWWKKLIALSHTSEKQRFEFFVPPGQYQFMAYGSGGKGGDPPRTSAATKHKRLTIEVKEGESDLDLGVIDLPPTKISTLIGKPAIEFGPIKAWKNGPSVKLADLIGKAVIIYFDGNSPNTSRDLPPLVELHEQFHGKGLVIIALYNNTSMEELEKKWIEVYERFGGVSKVPFRVAIDGGEPSFYEGTDKLRLGATYATYDITSDPTTILIDTEGKIVGELNLYYAKETLEKMLSVKPKLPIWRQRFDEVYRLEQGQVLKRVSPPFIPERRDYYLNEHSRQASAISRSPDRFTFHWDGKLKRWGVRFGSPDLNSALSHVFRLKSYEYELPEEFLSLELPGDWIIRDEAPQETKLKALEQLLADELGRYIRFQKRTVERKVIVATGRFRFRPLPEAPSDNRLYMFSDIFDDRGGGGGTAESVPEFLLALGNQVGIPVIDQTQSPDEIRIPYNHHHSSYLRRVKDKTEKAEKLRMMLDNLTKQTGLKFEISSQPVEVWFVTERNNDNR